MEEIIEVYEFDFGDQNLITENIQEIVDWIKTDIGDMVNGDELTFTITRKQMSIMEFKKLPEWGN